MKAALDPRFQPVLLEIKRAFPARKDQRLVDASEILGGWEASMFRLTLAFELDGHQTREDSVLRFYDGPDGAAQVEKDFQLLQHLESLAIPVPHAQLHAAISTYSSVPFLLMDALPGPTFQELIERGQNPSLSSIMTAPLVSLHAIRIEDLHPLQNVLSGMQQTETQFIPSRLGRIQADIERYRLNEFKPHLHWLESQPAADLPASLALLHNDYHQGNLLAPEGRPGAVVIDWGFADVGDIRLDLAWFGLLLAVQAGNGLRTQMITDYETLSGKRVADLAYFEALKFTERMLTIATWVDGSVEIPVPKITREAIRADYKIHVMNVYERLIEITGLRLPSIERL